MNKDEFDVLLPVAVKDVANLNFCLDRVFKNLKPRKIVVVSKNEIKNMIPENEYIEFCDEDNLAENLSLNTIKNIMASITGCDNRSGWYFQQFLKMAYATKSKTQYYLIWDSDTIPLNHLNFFEYDGGGGGYVYLR